MVSQGQPNGRNSTTIFTGSPGLRGSPLPGVDDADAIEHAISDRHAACQLLARKEQGGAGAAAPRHHRRQRQQVTWRVRVIGHISWRPSSFCSHVRWPQCEVPIFLNNVCSW